jgi:peptidoglycan/LPS O-acetylase OafA/YrhL
MEGVDEKSDDQRTLAVDPEALCEDVSAVAGGVPKERVYFPGLDGLRAVAIAMVYGFHDRHLDLLSYLVGWVKLPLILLGDPLLAAVGLPAITFRAEALLTQPFRTNGWIGVQLFFVLSGFLITTLLLHEHERFGRVDLQAFWVRRALRIWPLYYLIVAIGFGLLPRFDVGTTAGTWRSVYGVHLPAFLGFLGNWSMILRGPPPSDSLTVLWSVCVEEQFYLFVPLLVALVGPRWRVPVVAALIAFVVTNRYKMARSGIESVALSYNLLANFDTLLAGVLLALVDRRWPVIGRFTWLWRLLLLAGGVVIAAVPLGQGGPWRVAFDRVLIWAWAVAFVVLGAAPRDRWTAALRRPSVVWLGKISYGLYLIHEIAIGLVVALGVGLPSFAEKRFVLALVGPIVTIALATASYYGLERPFLRLKRRWTRVPSRPIDAMDERESNARTGSAHLFL